MAQNTTMSLIEHTMEHDNETYVIYCGRDAKGNDALLDASEPEDIWFHVANFSSGHRLDLLDRSATVRSKANIMQRFSWNIISEGGCSNSSVSVQLPRKTSVLSSMGQRAERGFRKIE